MATKGQEMTADPLWRSVTKLVMWTFGLGTLLGTSGGLLVGDHPALAAFAFMVSVAMFLGWLATLELVVKGWRC